eukprot:1619411-Heterocapsa_arctica.AAC.1
MRERSRYNPLSTNGCTGQRSWHAAETMHLAKKHRGTYALLKHSPGRKDIRRRSTPSKKIRR